MADPALETLTLDPHAWSDAPQVIVDALLARTGADLVIEAAQCGPIPAQVAQLLLAARASAQATGHALRIEHASAAARESLAALGLETLLEVGP